MITTDQVKATPMRENYAEASTVLDYLLRLLEQVRVQGEGFSGKRPFGNSSWEYGLYRVTADKLILGAIRSLK